MDYYLNFLIELARSGLATIIYHYYSGHMWIENFMKCCELNGPADIHECDCLKLHYNLACWLLFHSNQDIAEEEFEAEMGIVR